MALTRSSGILMPMSSLPSPYGIGTMGKAAYQFIDFLKAAGQKYWQLLPLGPTSYGDSPYASPSSFAGNPYYIDLDMLVKDGLLKKEDITGEDWGRNPAKTDYGKIYQSRYKVLHKAFMNGRAKMADKIAAFRWENSRWVENYALFMALKGKFKNTSWTEWPDDIRMRRLDAVARYAVELKEEIDFWIFMQYLFFRQWYKLKAYAARKGIGFIGDVPIYVAMDSADIWSEPQYFQLDENLRAKEVSGCPPDDFNDDGQLWGNPLYNYDRMREDGFGWWIRRIEGISRLYDVIRIDHFRGFESYWAVPAGDDTARNGVWRKGPGMDLVGRLTGWFSNITFIAEDLGYTTPEVKKLLADSGLPGMKVLEFAFYDKGESDHLPHNCPFNSTMYIGTHDNDTVKGWLKATKKADREYARKYTHITDDEGWCYGLIRIGMASPSNLFVMQMQDVLELPANCRMNTPGIPMGNWSWRMLPDAITPETAKRLAEMVKIYRR
jgi:4-alpha-glucanotransferase